MKTAIGYVRVSTEDQAKEGVSLEAQVAKIQAYASLKDFDLVEIIEDAGLSAKNLKRPGVQRVIELAKGKKIQAVIAFKLDRMFRSTSDALEITRKFDKWGVSFHSISESLDTKSAMGRFFFTLTAALAEMERGLIGERTKAVLQHKKANGELVGAVPWGFQLGTDGKTLEPNPVEQNVICTARELKGKGYSLRAISAELAQKGFVSRTNHGFGPEQVRRMLIA